MQNRSISKLYVFEGSKPIEIPELHAGDIGAIAKLDKARTGDTLSTKATPITLRQDRSFHSIYIQDATVQKTKGTRIK